MLSFRGSRRERVVLLFCAQGRLQSTSSFTRTRDRAELRNQYLSYPLEGRSNQVLDKSCLPVFEKASSVSLTGTASLTLTGIDERVNSVRGGVRPFGAI